GCGWAARPPPAELHPCALAASKYSRLRPQRQSALSPPAWHWASLKALAHAMPKRPRVLPVRLSRAQYARHGSPPPSTCLEAPAAPRRLRGGCHEAARCPCPVPLVCSALGGRCRPTEFADANRRRLCRS